MTNSAHSLPRSATSRPRPRTVLVRLARIVAIALIVGVGVSQLIFTVGDWHLKDAGAYWEAAMRLRDGEPLYPPLADHEASEVYRYAPWFAVAWIPLTYLPKDAVLLLWMGLCLGAAIASVAPLARAARLSDSASSPIPASKTR